MLFRPAPRLISCLTGLALAGALLVVAPPAQADVTDGYLGSEIDIDVYDSFGDLKRVPACASSANGDGTENEVIDDGVVQSQALDVTSTITEEGQADRTAHGSTSVGSRLTSTDGSWSTFDFAAALEGRVDPAAEGSRCIARLQGTVMEEFEFDLTEDGWVKIAWDFVSDGVAYAELNIGERRPRRGGVESYGKYVAGGSVSESSSFFMEAGEYSFGVYVYGDVAGKQLLNRGATAKAEDLTAFETSLNLAASFTPAGEARTALQGTGKRYVSVPDAVDCETNSIAPAMKANAKKLKFAKFYVNGKLVEKVKKPAKNKTVTLGGIDPSTHATVKVVVKTKKIVKKKKRNGKVIRTVIKPKKFTASRSFLACG
ncbi:hypothetical protein GCM10027020_33850 [Nocardioides salsibiostraticola]